MLAPTQTQSAGSSGSTYDPVEGDMGGTGSTYDPVEGTYDPVEGGVNVTVSTSPGSAFGRLGGGVVTPSPAQEANRTDFLVSGATLDLRILVTLT